MTEELESKKLKAEKEKLIGVWMNLQDEADGINERIHILTREIESLNLRIAQALKKEAHEAAKKAKAAAKPTNGKTHEQPKKSPQ